MERRVLLSTRRIVSRLKQKILEDTPDGVDGAAGFLSDQDRELLMGDTPGEAEYDRRNFQRWHESRGTSAKLAMTRLRRSVYERYELWVQLSLPEDHL